MSSHPSSGPPPEVIRSTSTIVPIASEQGAQSQLAKMANTDKPSKPPKKPLTERLPAGVYDNRPRDKRFVLHWLYFWFYARTGLYKISKAPMPRAAKNELATRELTRVEHLITEEFAQLEKLAKTHQPIIACLNSKGGAGKTVVATWLAVLIKLATLRSTIIVDANENKGGTSMRLGVVRTATLMLREFLNNAEKFSTHDTLNQALASHTGSGVLVISSEANKKGGFSQTLFVERIRSLHAADHTTVLDVGNGIPYPANRGSVVAADVLVFVATIKQPDSFEDLNDTRIAYAADEQHYRFGDKVENGIVVLLGVTESERLEYIATYGWNSDKVFVVPEDPFMVGMHVVTWEKIRPDTQLALARIARAIFETSPEVASWKDNSAASQNAAESDSLDSVGLQFAAPVTMEGRIS
jgi:MinD-like ATPase involved in chromosome partitioning or flagellar assembly